MQAAEARQIDRAALARGETPLAAQYNNSLRAESAIFLGWMKFFGSPHR
jgi:hypothetical protein